MPILIWWGDYYFTAGLVSQMAHLIDDWSDLMTATGSFLFFLFFFSISRPYRWTKLIPRSMRFIRFFIPRASASCFCAPLLGLWFITIINILDWVKQYLPVLEKTDSKIQYLGPLLVRTFLFSSSIFQYITPYEWEKWNSTFEPTYWIFESWNKLPPLAMQKGQRYNPLTCA